MRKKSNVESGEWDYVASKGKRTRQKLFHCSQWFLGNTNRAFVTSQRGESNRTDRMSRGIDLMAVEGELGSLVAPDASLRGSTGDDTRPPERLTAPVLLRRTQAAAEAQLRGRWWFWVEVEASGAVERTEARVRPNFVAYAGLSGAVQLAVHLAFLPSGTCLLLRSEGFRAWGRVFRFLLNTAVRRSKGYIFTP